MKKGIFVDSLLIIFCLSIFLPLSALEKHDEEAILGIIQSYTDSWNRNQGKGYADGFTDDADFVNIYGMRFSGKNEIEERHVKILHTFLKDSQISLQDVQFRQVDSRLVIAWVSSHW